MPVSAFFMDPAEALLFDIVASHTSTLCPLLGNVQAAFISVNCLDYNHKL